MPRHHYVPKSILKRYVSAEAWRFVSAPSVDLARIAKTDKATLESGQDRNWPLCVFDKRRNRYSRKLLRDVCSQASLYIVPNYNDPLTRGFIRFILFTDKIPYQNPSLEDLTRHGELAMDQEEIEKVYVGALDANFAELCKPLINGYMLDEEEITILLKFISFSRFRTPVWRQLYYPEALKRSFAPLLKYLGNIIATAKRDLDKETAQSFINIESSVDTLIYNMAMIEYSGNYSKELMIDDARVVVLHTKGDIPFITCDNPGRPYRPDRIRRLVNEDLPGFADPRTEITYPISPACSILITSNKKYPKFVHDVVDSKRVRIINSARAIMALEQIIFPCPKKDVFQEWLDLTTNYRIRRP